MTYVMYGQATFTTTNRRDQAVTAIRRAATDNGLTPRLWGGYVGGCQTVAQRGITICYTTESQDVAEAVDRAVMAALQSGQYDGDFGWQDMGLEQAQRR